MREHFRREFEEGRKVAAAAVKTGGKPAEPAKA